MLFRSPLMLHEEDLAKRGNGVVHDGENARQAGIAGIPRAVEETMTARDIFYAEKLEAPIHICHVSTAGSVEPVSYTHLRVNNWRQQLTAPTAGVVSSYFDGAEDVLNAANIENIKSSDILDIRNGTTGSQETQGEETEQPAYRLVNSCLLYTSRCV